MSEEFLNKRDVLLCLAELYLNTTEDNEINVNDGIFNSTKYGANSFLMLTALAYSNDEWRSIYSMDSCISEEERKSFIDLEYKKIRSMRKDKEILGKTILKDARNHYNKYYAANDDLDINEVSKNILF